MSKIDHRKELYVRLVISNWDFTQVKNYLGIIIKKKLHERKDADSKHLHEALNAALIVAYSRPFTSNNKQPGKVSSLPNKLIRAFTAEEKQLHKRITHREGLRNRFFAHSDSEALKVIVNFDKFCAVPIMHNPFVPLSEPETQLLLSMTNKLLVQISLRLDEIQSEIPIGSKI